MVTCSRCKKEIKPGSSILFDADAVGLVHSKCVDDEPLGANADLGAEIERLRKEIQTQNTIIGLLRAQIRIGGEIPCVVETRDIGDAEYKMRQHTN